MLHGIRSYEPSELVVTVRSGTPLAELEALLQEKGQCLPFEPPHYTWSKHSGATVGGMVASGWSGPARASVGGVRDYVLGLQMINGLGEHLTFGGQVMKNVAGYDVSRLMVGAMGTLGLITEVSLKVLPVAPSEATLCFELPQYQALEQLHVWGGLPLPLNASCWVRDTTGPGAAASSCLCACAVLWPRWMRPAAGRWTERPASAWTPRSRRSTGRCAATIGCLFYAPATAWPGAVAPELAANRAGAGPALGHAGGVARCLALGMGAGGRLAPSCNRWRPNKVDVLLFL